MTTKRYLLVLLFSFFVIASLFTVIPTESRVGYYDPWIDLNDDGKIDMKDVTEIARAYGSLGEPMNKTALLLDLNETVQELQKEILRLTNEVGILATCIEDMAFALNSRINDLEIRVGELESLKRNYICVYSAAFNPTDETQTFLNGYAGLMGGGYFFANVQLPNGATITNMTVYAMKTSAIDLEVALTRGDLDSLSGLEIAYTDTTDALGSGSPEPFYPKVFNSAWAEVDNQEHSYYLVADFAEHSTNLRLVAVVIEYEC